MVYNYVEHYNFNLFQITWIFWFTKVELWQGKGSTKFNLVKGVKFWWKRGLEEGACPCKCKRQGGVYPVGVLPLWEWSCPCKGGSNLGRGVASSCRCKRGSNLERGVASSCPCKRGSNLGRGVARSCPCKRGHTTVGKALLLCHLIAS